MQRRWTISTVIRYAIFALFVLAIFRFDATINSALGLYGPLIASGEVWRLLSYPFSIAFGGLIIGGIAFSQPGEEIESMLGMRSFGLSLVVATIAIGLLHMLITLNLPMPMLGASNLGLFVLVGYLYLFPQSSTGILFFRVSTRTIVLVALGLALVLGTIETIDTGQPVFLSYGLFGAIAGAAFFHVRYRSYPVMLGVVGPIARFFRVDGTAPLQGSLRLIDDQPGRQSAPDRLSAQERADELLDKIAKEGIDALSKKERAFLEEYSKQL